MAGNAKGSLSNLIARARAAQEEAPTDEPPGIVEEASAPRPTAAPSPVVKAPQKAPKSAKKGRATEKAPRTAKKVEPAGEPAVPEPAPDRRIGRRGDPNYRQANAYIPKALHLRVKRALLDEGDREFSSLVEELLETWLAGKEGT